MSDSLVPSPATAAPLAGSPTFLGIHVQAHTVDQPALAPVDALRTALGLEDSVDLNIPPFLLRAYAAAGKQVNDARRGTVTKLAVSQAVVLLNQDCHPSVLALAQLLTKEKLRSAHLPHGSYDVSVWLGMDRPQSLATYVVPLPKAVRTAPRSGLVELDFIVHGEKSVTRALAASGYLTEIDHCFPLLFGEGADVRFIGFLVQGVPVEAPPKPSAHYRPGQTFEFSLAIESSSTGAVDHVKAQAVACYGTAPVFPVDALLKGLNWNYLLGKWSIHQLREHSAAHLTRLTQCMNSPGSFPPASAEPDGWGAWVSSRIDLSREAARKEAALWAAARRPSSDPPPPPPARPQPPPPPPRGREGLPPLAPPSRATSPVGPRSAVAPGALVLRAQSPLAPRSRPPPREDSGLPVAKARKSMEGQSAGHSRQSSLGGDEVDAVVTALVLSAAAGSGAPSLAASPRPQSPVAIPGVDTPLVRPPGFVGNLTYGGLGAQYMARIRAAELAVRPPDPHPGPQDGPPSQ
jgi:hypothetical protein